MPPVLGGAILGKQTNMRVYIAPSDDPYGLIGFSSTALATPESGDGVEIVVVRQGGSLGLVEVAWGVEGGGGDVSPLDGVVYFLSGETRRVIALLVEDDQQPEGDEVREMAFISFPEWETYRITYEVREVVFISFPKW